MSGVCLHNRWVCEQLFAVCLHDLCVPVCLQEGTLKVLLRYFEGTNQTVQVHMLINYGYMFATDGIFAIRNRFL